MYKVRHGEVKPTKQFCELTAACWSFTALEIAGPSRAIRGLIALIVLTGAFLADMVAFDLERHSYWAEQTDTHRREIKRQRGLHIQVLQQTEIIRCTSTEAAVINLQN